MSSLDSVVKVTATITPQFTDVESFNIALLVGQSARLPLGARIGTYTGMDDVKADFQSTDEEYIAAQAWFSMQPQPGILKIARRITAAVPGELLGTGNYDKILADYTAIANGALKLSIDGVQKTFQGINLANVVSLPGVAAALQAAIVATSAGVTVTFDGKRFIIRSGTTGPNSAVGAVVAAGVGTDLGPLLAIRPADGATSTVGAIADASIAASMDSLAGIDDAFYGFAFTKEILGNVADVQAAAAWGLANTRMYQVTVLNSVDADSTNQTGIGYLLNNTAQGYAIVTYDANGNAYSGFEALARGFVVDLDRANSSITLWGKQLPGVAPSKLTAAQQATLKSRSINFYVPFGSNARYVNGVMADGTPYDVRVGVDWLVNHIQVGIAEFAFDAVPKLSQTDNDMQRAVQQMHELLDDAVANGLLAPGTWRLAPVKDIANNILINTGDTMPLGYYVYALPMSSQDEPTRETRVAPDAFIYACGAGALQGFNIMINFQQ